MKCKWIFSKGFFLKVFFGTAILFCCSGQIGSETIKKINSKDKVIFRDVNRIEQTYLKNAVYGSLYAGVRG